MSHNVGTIIETSTIWRSGTIFPICQKLKYISFKNFAEKRQTADSPLILVTVHSNWHISDSNFIFSLSRIPFSRKTEKNCSFKQIRKRWTVHRDRPTLAPMEIPKN